MYFISCLDSGVADNPFTSITSEKSSLYLLNVNVCLVVESSSISFHASKYLVTLSLDAKLTG